MSLNLLITTDTVDYTRSYDGYATVLVLKGAVKMTFETENLPLAPENIFELSENMMLSFDARVVHDLVAQAPSQVLVTISERLS